VHNLGRTLVAALLALTVLVPTAAVAGEAGDPPLSDVPSEYVPALRAAADGLGLSYDELTSASEDELKTLLCDELDTMSTQEVVAQARAALEKAPEEEVGDAEREQLMANLPMIIEQVASEYCDGDDVKGDDVTDEDITSDVDDDVTSDDDVPVPTHVDTGGGGAGGAGMVPAAFGALFAGLFGLVGVGITRRSTG
jgi:hypothetical protein